MRWFQIPYRQPHGLLNQRCSTRGESERKLRCGAAPPGCVPPLTPQKKEQGSTLHGQCAALSAQLDGDLAGERERSTRRCAAAAASLPLSAAATTALSRATSACREAASASPAASRMRCTCSSEERRARLGPSAVDARRNAAVCKSCKGGR